MTIQLGKLTSPRMTKMLASFYVAGLLVTTGAVAAPDNKKMWITVGEAAFSQLQRAVPGVMAKESQVVPSQGLGTQSVSAETVHLVAVDEEQMLRLSSAVHGELKRCGGFMAHETEVEGSRVLKQLGQIRPAAVTAPNYTIDQQAVVPPMLAQMEEAQVAQTIIDLSAFANRYYKSTNGANASDWLKQKWATMAAGRSDISVDQFTHSSWGQKSVILTIHGTDNASEVVVLGGHLDTINQGGTSETTKAPGADDDASGIASMTEGLRAIVASGYKPRRTIKMMGYAAEEAGLLGSQAIAKSFKANSVNVVGVMQLDMTNYKGSDSDIFIYTDYTNSAQNDFVVRLINTYLPTLKIGYDKCGYGCSDHASWHGQGYATSMPFEAAFNQDNPYIHTSNDTYANSGNQAAHALKFARLAVAYAVELGSDGPAAPPPAEKVETFSGSLTGGQNQSYGPFKVGAGGGIKATVTGSGDTDLYVRKSSAASISRYDCKSDGSTSSEKCSLNLTSNNDVYVLLYGYRASTYTLNLSYLPQ